MFILFILNFLVADSGVEAKDCIKIYLGMLKHFINLIFYVLSYSFTRLDCYQ